MNNKDILFHCNEEQNMGDVFKINLRKANQCAKYSKVMFKKYQTTGKGLVIDDSCFSGTTLEGLQHSLTDFEFLTIFSK